MKYFLTLPKTTYGSDLVTNIFTRVAIRHSERLPTEAYYPVVISEGQRADHIARSVYGTTDDTWLIWLANKTLDPKFEWPLTYHEFKQYIENKRNTGLQLSVLGYGTGNYNDALMEELSNRGNGNAAYIDNLKEAQKVLVNEMSSTLQTIASDVKLQMEFNPQWVQEYRLLGYENRVLAREDFNNDNVDAGDIGAGHSLTAIYELTLTNAQKPWNDPLRYTDSPEKKAITINSNELGLLKIRYKLPNQTTSQLLKFPVNKNEMNNNINSTSEAFRFASSVAGFSELLRRSQYIKSYGYSDVIAQAENAKGSDRYGYRSEFVQLARLAQALSDEPVREN